MLSRYPFKHSLQSISNYIEKLKTAKNSFISYFSLIEKTTRGQL